MIATSGFLVALSAQICFRPRGYRWGAHDASPESLVVWGVGQPTPIPYPSTPSTSRSRRLVTIPQTHRETATTATTGRVFNLF